MQSDVLILISYKRFSRVSGAYAIRTWYLNTPEEFVLQDSTPLITTIRSRVKSTQIESQTEAQGNA